MNHSQKFRGAEEFLSTDHITNKHQCVKAFLTKLSRALMLRRQTGCIYKQQLLTSSLTDWHQGQVSTALETLLLFYC